jgi:hypothetical protein
MKPFTEQRGQRSRYGGRIRDDLFYRGHIKRLNRDSPVIPTGREDADD